MPPQNGQSKQSISVSIEDGTICATFATKQLADEFAKLEFYSRVLHSLTPEGAQRIWREGNRLDVEIRGLPKWIHWKRTSEKAFRGSPTSDKTNALDSYRDTLTQAIMSVLIGTTDNSERNSVYHFSIGKENEWTNYYFSSKARTIAALCVLFDLAPHPRNDLELQVPAELGVQPSPTESKSNSDGKEIRRTYGDPSKTADELRNEGWPRTGKNIGIRFFQQIIGGARQQMYQLTRREQHLESRVVRTNIPARWKLELYDSQNYTCRICHRKYAAKYLEPDHRIPVIVRLDELTESNFKQKLMTLCRYCNQVKREACKVIAETEPDYDWTTSPWAYPEKFEFEKIKREIESYAVTSKQSKKDVLKSLEN